jgi:putative hydrolase of the HAD superfamily
MISSSAPLVETSTRIASDFSHVETWVFDLDNTLYPPSARLFDQIEARMSRWIQDRLAVDITEAERLRRHYWAQYGTTLAGLMQEHRIDGSAFLDHVHDIDMGGLRQNQALIAAITALPGRRIVFTNADIRYAGRVLRACGLDGLFDAVYGVEEAGFLPKPDPEAFRRIFGRDGLDPGAAAMFEDDPRNLAAPHAMGLRTVLVGPAEQARGQDHIHHQTEDLAGFLCQIRA